MAKKSQKTTEISYRHIIPKSISCALTTNTTLQTVLQCSISKMLQERKEKQWLLPPTFLTWDTIPTLEAEQAWFPLLNWGGVDTAWHVAIHWTLLKILLSVVFWWGPECWVWSRPLRVGAIITEPPLILVLGVPAQASFLRLQPPRHIGTLSSMLRTQKGLVWTGCLWTALGEKEVRFKPLGLIQAQAHSTLIHRPESQLSLRNQRWARKSAAILWTFSVTTTWSPVHTGTSIHKGCGSVKDSCPQEMPWGAYWWNIFQNQPTPESQVPKVNCPHTL